MKKNLYCFLILLLVCLACNKNKLQVNNDLPEFDSTQTISIDSSIYKKYFFNCQEGDTIFNVQYIEGYSDKISYFPSETINLYIHSKSKTFKMELYRFGKTIQLIDSRFSDNGIEQHLPCHTYKNGCAWKSTESYKLPDFLKSGLYSFKLIEENGIESWITFIVKKQPKADILVLASTNTWQAYNRRGRASYYYNQVDPSSGKNADVVSFNRPNSSDKPIVEDANRTVIHLADAEAYLTKWLESNEYDYEMISDEDLHSNSYILSNYKVLIIHTHPEYWTENMRSNLETFLAFGGNLLYLGGNGIYWKVVYNSINRTMEVRVDHKRHKFDFTQGGLWKSLEKPASQLLGISYTNSGIGTYAPYKVFDESHWIFQGTNLKKDDLFAENCEYCEGGSGHETDRPDGSSPKMDTLAIGTNPNNGGAYMVYFKDTATNSQVFSVGSITFTRTLMVDQNCSRITKNVLDEFLK